MSILVRILPRSIGDQYRRRRSGLFKQIILKNLQERGSCRILDVGGSLPYWDLCAPELMEDERIVLDLLNLNYGEEDRAAALNRPNIRLQQGDARDLSDLADNSYDLAHSNSVIEHVGRWTDMMAMAQEVQRVGRTWFVQTPYYGFPMEPHFRTPFVHWLPEQWRLRLLMSFNLGFGGRATSVDHGMRAVQSACLLDRRQFAALFPSSNIHSELAWGLTKSLMAVGGEGIVADSRSNRRALRV